MIDLAITPTTLGPKIRERRLALGLSRGDFAANAGISVSYLSEIENGVHANPTMTILRIMGAELKCNFLITAGPYSATE